MSDLYTKIFVRTPGSRADLLGHVRTALGGEVDGWTLLADNVEVDVDTNDDASSPPEKVAELDAFLYFPLTVEVVGVGGRIELEQYLKRVGSLMTYLHDRGMSVVAACDWEDQLPSGGRLR